MSINMFETAIRSKYRFEDNQRGGYTIENLYDLPLNSQSKTSLNSIAKYINKQLRELEQDDFVGEVDNTVANKLQNMLNIVVHIISVRKEENKATLEALNKKNQLQEIRELKKLKLKDQMGEKTLEELQEMEKQLMQSIGE